jgi:nicotinamidase-related amidase
VRKSRFATDNPALIIVDVQKAIDHPSWGLRNNPDAELRIRDLLDVWRSRRWPIFHVRHSSVEPDSTYRPDQPGFEFKPEVTPASGETVITKQVNSAFIGTTLLERLREARIEELVVCGVITNNSVDATVRNAANLGFSVFMPADAIATFDLKTLGGRTYPAEEIHDIFLSNLHGEYGEVIKTSDILESDQF